MRILINDVVENFTSYNEKDGIGKGSWQRCH